MVCKNCETVFEGKFCHECGQKSLVERITFRAVFSDLIKKITNWDKGLMYTTVQVMQRPGKMAQAFIGGHRVNFTKPLNYILIIVAASVLVFPRRNIEKAMDGINQHGRNSGPFMDWIFSNISIIYLMMIPFLAIVTKWFNRKKDYNFAELFVFYCYLMAGCTLVSTVFTVLGNIFDQDAITATPLGLAQYSAWILFFAWGYVQFFGKERNYWGGIQGAIVLLLAYFIYILIFSLTMGIVLLLLKLVFNIEIVPLAPPNNVSPTQ